MPPRSPLPSPSTPSRWPSCSRWIRQTSAALSKNPTDPAALPTALSEVAKQQGASAATQANVKSIATKRIDELITASAIDATTLAALSGGSTAPDLIAKAQGEIAAARNITSAAALTRLLALASAPVKADLAVVTPYANALLAANKAIPAADLALIQKYGSGAEGCAGRHPAGHAGQADQGRQRHPAPVAALVVGLLHRADRVPAVHLPADRALEPEAGTRDEEEHEALVERELAELHQHAQA